MEREGSSGPEWEVERGGIQVSRLSSQKENPKPAMREVGMGTGQGCGPGDQPV